MEETANQIENIPFDEVISALLDTDTPLKPRYLYRLSDLNQEDYASFQKTWPFIATWRKQALIEDLELLFSADYLLSFESISRLALRDSDSLVRFNALRSLQEYEVEDLIPVIVATLEADPDNELRALAASVLGKYIYQGELDELPKPTLAKIETCLLAAANDNASELVRRHALESLGYSSRREVHPLIRNAFRHQKNDWIASAILAMGRSCDKRWQRNVLEMLDHPYPDIRFEAVRAAGELEIEEAKPILLERLDDDDGIIRMAAVWSLSQIGGEGLSKIFEKMIDELEDDQEIDHIENALDNLIFFQSLGDFPDEFDDDFDDDFDIED